MMMLLVIMILLPPILAVIWLSRIDGARTARLVALASAGTAVVAAGTSLLVRSEGLTLGLFELGFLPAMPLLTSLTGLAAVAMSPMTTDVRSIRRILAISVMSSLTVLSSEPVLIALFWSLTAIPVWLELKTRRGSLPVGRLFLIYFVPGAACAIAGALLVTNGQYAAGAAALLVAIAIRSALVPFHSWLPALMESVPMGMVAVFVSPQLGIYLYLRVVPADTLVELVPAMSVLAVVTAIGAGALGLVQRRAQRALAYVLMSEGALVAFGVGVHGEAARTGMVGTLMVVGLATAGFLMALAALEARRGVLFLDRPTGGYERIPLLATAFLVLGLASVGMPGTFGFIVEDLLFEGAVGEHPWLTSVLIATTALNGITVLRCFFFLFMGDQRYPGERDLLPREWMALTLLLSALVIEGLWPAAGLRTLGIAGETRSGTEVTAAGLVGEPMLDTVPARP